MAHHLSPIPPHLEFPMISEKASVSCVSIRFRFNVLSAPTPNGHRVQLADLSEIEAGETQNADAFYFVRKFHQLLTAEDTPNCYSCILYGSLVEILDFLWQFLDIYLSILPLSGKIEDACNAIFSMKELISVETEISESFYENEISFDPGEEGVHLSAYIRMDAYDVAFPQKEKGKKSSKLPSLLSNPLCLTIKLEKEVHTLQTLESLGEALHSSVSMQLILRCGAVRQSYPVDTEHCYRFHLVLAETWEEVIRYFRCVPLDALIGLPSSKSSTQLSSAYTLSFDCKPLFLKLSQQCLSSPSSLNILSPPYVALALTALSHQKKAFRLNFEVVIHRIGDSLLTKKKFKETRVRTLNPPPSSSEPLSSIASPVEELPISTLQKISQGCSAHSPSSLHKKETFLQESEEFLHTWRLSIDCLGIQLFTFFQNGFCAYTFNYSSSAIQKMLLAQPLPLQIWSRDAYKSDQFLGEAFLPLSSLLEQPLFTLSTDSNKLHTYRSLDGIFYVDNSKGEDSSTVGFVRVQLYLEDLGQSESPFASLPVISTLSRESAQKGDSWKGVRTETLPEPSFSPRRDTEVPLSTPLLDLEAWKSLEGAKFSNLLQTKTLEMQQKLEDEFLLKDKERQMEFENKRSQLQHLEIQLRKKAQELQKQATELQLQHTRLAQEKETLKCTAQRTSEEFSSVTRRLKQEHEQSLQLERERFRDLTERKALLQGELDEIRPRIRLLEKEITEAKKQLYDAPSYKLQSDLNIKTYEVEDLRNKLEVMTSSRDHFFSNCKDLLERLGEFRKNESGLNDAARWKTDFMTRLEGLYQNMQLLYSGLSPTLSTNPGSITASHRGNPSVLSTQRGKSASIPNSLVRSESNRATMKNGRNSGQTSSTALRKVPSTGRHVPSPPVLLKSNERKGHAVVSAESFNEQNYLSSMKNHGKENSSAVAGAGSQHQIKVNEISPAVLPNVHFSTQENDERTHYEQNTLLNESDCLGDELVAISQNVVLNNSLESNDPFDQTIVQPSDGFDTLQKSQSKYSNGSGTLLEKEIDRLLQVGLYSEEDKVIQDMRRKLNEHFDKC
ncbi:hypothetical protein IE077_002845 [Cardiosporidium cionae]|uniref:Uncharacterized protein n=1 Tax=Cardiosporidium cionae TaxID=476202 RepID=A0ABQ7JA03_9APIC|nr:hypothetical protein IE077_002845 [Cardiosporidium cionae]|eukprot:KAF8820754.1 hypothetical protein IE077_002845 [Cardiosporidium cionae]